MKCKFSLKNKKQKHPLLNLEKKAKKCFAMCARWFRFVNAKWVHNRIDDRNKIARQRKKKRKKMYLMFFRLAAWLALLCAHFQFSTPIRFHFSYSFSSRVCKYSFVSLLLKLAILTFRVGSVKITIEKIRYQCVLHDLMCV